MNIPYKKQYSEGVLINPIEGKYPTLMPNRRSRRARPARAHGESRNYHLQVVGRRAFLVRKQVVVETTKVTTPHGEKKAYQLKNGKPVTKTIVHYLERK